MKAAGLEPMPNDVAIRMLPTVLSPQAGTQIVLAGADWPRLAEAYRMRAAVKVLDGSARAATLVGLQLLVTAGAVPDHARAYRLDTDRVVSLVGMEIPAEQQRATLTALGFEIPRSVERDTGLELPPDELAQLRRLDRLCAAFDEQLAEFGGGFLQSNDVV